MAPDTKGFTAFELVLTTLLVSIVTYVGFNTLNQNSDASRYEATRAQLAALQVAILGDTDKVKSHQTSFGYVGDWGSLPVVLASLVTAQAPAWTYNSLYGIGGGWHGPYVVGLTSVNVSKDSWGRNFSYTVGSPTTITSFGSDGVAGGNFYATDLILSIANIQWEANVYGRLMNGALGQLQGQLVQLVYPVNGTLTAFTTTTDDQGNFSFANVPFGIRSLSVVATPPLGPVQLAIDHSPYIVPADLTNYMGNYTH